MKSDREFLDGIYAKAEELQSPISTLDHDLKHKGNYNKPTQNQHTYSSKHVKYAGLVASFLLLLSSALYINNYIDINKQIDNQPVPSNFRMIQYTDQLMEQATDIVEIRAKYENDVITIDIVKSYKDSGNESKLSNYLNSDVIGLTADHSAIVFIDVNSKDIPIMDIFVLEADSNSFINPYGEIITNEILGKSN